MDQGENSASFDLLNVKIQKWIWQQGWTDLREAQELAIGPILSGDEDIIISSGTASGKTEAAFLPIISKLLENEPVINSVLHISPLRALINDQFSRMELLCRNMDIQVVPWHGDISTSKKRKFFDNPRGILLITPESLEAIFVNYGSNIPRVFKKLSYIVVDELHSFIGTERGRQLQSLLHRIEISVNRRISRIGLSATISDMQIASFFLRPVNSSNVLSLTASGSQELKLIIKGYMDSALEIALPLKDGDFILQKESLPKREAEEIADSLFQTLRGTSNLIFANSRANVEKYADALRTRCEEMRVPNEFWAHHGSLSKELREEAEKAIKDKSRPVTIVCTSTLELGIDIGAVTSIAQVGIPPSVSSLRQRLGRSGRRGEPAILRIYIRENETSIKSTIEDQLRVELVQAIAMIRLLINNWLEPPSNGSLHLSTLVQQILSLIAQCGGITASQAWRILCETGPFGNIDTNTFIKLLRCMGQHDLLIQASDGLLLHGKAGEKIVNHFSFYTVFMTGQEYRLVAEGKTLGTLPIERPVSEGSLIIFGGRRWRVLNIDDQHKIIELTAAKGGIPPSFTGVGGIVHDYVRQEMYSMYRETGIPAFLDAKAKELFLEGRENFKRYHLENRNIISHGNLCYLFCWAGDRVQDTVVILLNKFGLKAENSGIAITVSDISPAELKNKIKNLISSSPVNGLELARSVKNKISEKYHPLLASDLLDYEYCSARLDIVGALNALSRICH